VKVSESTHMKPLWKQKKGEHSIRDIPSQSFKVGVENSSTLGSDRYIEGGGWSGAVGARWDKGSLSEGGRHLDTC